jgi:hypothetical protein
MSAQWYVKATSAHYPISSPDCCFIKVKVKVKVKVYPVEKRGQKKIVAAVVAATIFF